MFKTSCSFSSSFLSVFTFGVSTEVERLAVNCDFMQSSGLQHSKRSVVNKTDYVVRLESEVGLYFESMESLEDGVIRS